MTYLAIVLVTTVGFLLLASLLDDRASMDDWADLQSPAAADAYWRLRERWAQEQVMADMPFTLAERQQQAGAQDEALRLLGVGVDFLQRVTPDRREKLRQMVLMSRMVAAIAPLPPLQNSGFRLRELHAAAVFGSTLQRILVSSVERWRIRVRVLRFGFWLALQAITRSNRRAQREADFFEREWRQILEARRDWTTISDESLESFRVLAIAIATEPRIAAAAAKVRS